MWCIIHASRVIGSRKGEEVPIQQKKCGRAVDDESNRVYVEQQLASIPANLCGTSGFGAPAALAQQITEQLELDAKFALLQRCGIIENEKQIARAFSKECPSLVLHEVSDALFEHGQMGRRCNSFLPPQSCCLVVQGIDDRGKYETRPVVVELDKLPTTPRGKMKIPSTEKANLGPPELHDRRRLAQGRHLPGPAGGNTVKGTNEIGYFGEDSAGDDLMLRYHRKFCRYLWHPGSPQRGVEVLGRPRLEPQANPHSLRRNAPGFGLST